MQNSELRIQNRVNCADVSGGDGWFTVNMYFGCCHKTGVSFLTNETSLTPTPARELTMAFIPHSGRPWFVLIGRGDGYGLQ